MIGLLRFVLAISAGPVLSKVDELCLECDRQVREQWVKYSGTDKAINGPIERRFR
jgi:hypothetical protein